jgi:hypothetical protein
MWSATRKTSRTTSTARPSASAPTLPCTLGSRSRHDSSPANGSAVAASPGEGLRGGCCRGSRERASGHAPTNCPAPPGSFARRDDAAVMLRQLQLTLLREERLLGKVVVRIPLRGHANLHRQRGAVGVDLLPPLCPTLDRHRRDSDAAHAQRPSTGQPHIRRHQTTGVVQSVRLIDVEVVRCETIRGRASCTSVCDGSAVEALVFHIGGEV